MSLYKFLVIAFLVAAIALSEAKLSDKRGDESKYTKSELVALSKLKKLIVSDLYADYMHRDEYLIPWLRTKKLDVGQAVELLKAVSKEISSSE